MSKTQHSWSRGLLFSPRISRLIKEVDENNDDEIELSEFLCLLGHVRRLMLLGEQGMTYHPRVSRKSFYALCHTILVYICEVLGAHIFRSTLANHLRTQRHSSDQLLNSSGSKSGAILLVFQNVEGRQT